MITTSLFHDTRREKQNKKYPVKLCVNYIHKAKYYATGIDLTKDEFDKLKNKRNAKEIAAVRNELHTIEANAKAIIKTLKPFGFNSFERKFSEKPIYQDPLAAAFQDKISQLKREGRLGTASSYECCIHSLQKFKEKLTFDDINVDFLCDYENHMTEEGNSKTTVGIYLRTLRAVFNEAVENGILSKDAYPFGKRKYQIPTGRNIKKALKLADIGKIYYYEPDAPHDGMARAKDFWLFSYFANGINMKDIALLKFRHIQGEYIVFERAKTLRTTRSNPKPISIYITGEMKQIMDRWSNVPTSPEDYIFPILEPRAHLERQRKLIQQFTKNTNKWMKEIGNRLELNMPVTTYAARHSFSTVLKRSGASTEFISEALGHTEVKTTESYLDSFENETKKQFAGNLIAFKKEKNINAD
jgi:integrase/recombinase XerD